MRTNSKLLWAKLLSLAGWLAMASVAWAHAAEKGVATLYLLTTTAADFFGRRGYEAVPRSAAPAAIAATPQFRDLCPASSVLMRKAIGKPR